MRSFRKLFGPKKCSVVGMVHVGALPGTPLYSGCIQKLIDKSLRETEVYLKNNMDGILIENMHDIPYVQSHHFEPETTAVMTKICSEIKNIIPKNVPCGVQVLAGGNKEALAIAKSCSLDFIRCEGFVFSHIGDEGFTDANAGTILRYRKKIDAENVMIFADIKKKHSSHAITSDISLTETAKAAEFFLADGVILTGTSTGSPADEKELQELKSAVELPILVGSGVTIENLEKYITADALIVGSHFKTAGKWQNDLNNEQITDFMKKLNYLQ